MELTVDNFQLALGIISGRTIVLNETQLAIIGIDIEDGIPSPNLIRAKAEEYITTALIDLSTRLYTVEARLNGLTG